MGWALYICDFALWIGRVTARGKPLPFYGRYDRCPSFDRYVLGSLVMEQIDQAFF